MKKDQSKNCKIKCIDQSVLREVLHQDRATIKGQFSIILYCVVPVLLASSLFVVAAASSSETVSAPTWWLHVHNGCLPLSLRVRGSFLYLPGRIHGQTLQRR
jgi:hypothetical protein